MNYPVGRLLLVTLLLVTSIATHAQTQVQSAEGAYGVQPGDVLTVSVWKEISLQGDVLVRPDGGFSFPLVGDVQARGRPVAAISAEITERLQRYIPDPVVVVSVKEIRGNKIFVIGKVNRPDEFILSRDLDVMQALSMAGGTALFADLDGIRILRRSNDGTQISLPFNYSEVAEGKNLQQNILLETGDVVVVP